MALVIDRKFRFKKFIQGEIFIMALVSLKKQIETRIPKCIWRMLRRIIGFLFLVGTSRTAAFALKMRVRGQKLTFEKKILFKMAYDRSPLLSIYADKVKVREFVTERVGSEYLALSFGVYENIKSSDIVNFPRNFVLKSNHGSGASVICWSGAPRGVKIPVDISNTSWEKFLIHPDDLDSDNLIGLSDKWMTLNYYWDFGRYPEWAYKAIRPLLLVEELLLDGGGLPIDYKFQMINGKCAFIQVDVSRYGHHQRNLYTENWELINARTRHPQIISSMPKPRELDEMLKVSEELSKGIDFVRIDLYAIEGRVVFGEMTNYPNGGLKEIWPRSLSIELARKWVL
jgi:hypothetical protein